MRNKTLIIAGLVSVSAAAFAYPNVDMSVGGSPFMLLQQQQFQKNELNDYKQFKDAFDNNVENRTDSVEQLQSEYNVRDLKQPAKIQLGGSKTETSGTGNPEMQLINKDGTIQIKRLED